MNVDAGPSSLTAAAACVSSLQSAERHTSHTPGVGETQPCSSGASDSDDTELLLSPAVSECDMSDEDILHAILEEVAEVTEETPEVTVETGAPLRLDQKAETFRNELKTWALQNNITHTAVGSLLKILKAHPCHFDLPSDARTLLETRRNRSAFSIVSVPPAHYCHFGLRCGLLTILNRMGDVPERVSISLNVDGLPISKSSKTQLWPIQCLAVSVQSMPFLVGVYAGSAKPASANDFLNSVVEELQSLLSDGLSVRAYTVCVELKHIICDAPARAFVFLTVGHNAFSGCPKCMTEGQHEKNRTVFLDSSASLRTDESFRAQRDPDHHKGTSILTSLPID